MAEKKYEFEETMVTLVDEDGKEKPFYVDEMYMVKDQMYAALIPGDVENVTEYYVFRVEDIDDEEEYDAAADAYEECLDTRLWNRTLENE